MRKILLFVILGLSALVSHAQYTRVICSGTSFSYSDNIVFPGGLFTWTAPNSGANVITGGSANATPSSTVSQTLALVNPNNVPVVVTYTVTDIVSSTVFTVAVTVNPTPTVSAVTSQTILNGTSTNTIVFGGAVASTTFNWTNSNTSIGLGASIGSGNIGSFSGTNTSLTTATANFTVTPVANGCTGTSRNFTIKVDPTNLVTCSNTALNYSDAAVFASANYTWLMPVVTGGMSGGTASSGAAINDVLVNATNTPQTATYSVTETTSGTSFTLVFTINPTPSVSAIGSQMLCNGASTNAINFTAGATNVANTTYSWTNNTPSIGITSGTGNISPFVAINNTTAPVTATVTVTPISNTCNGSTQTFTIVVNPTPVLSSTLTPAGICNGTSFSYTGTSATTGTVFSWSRAAVAGVSSDIYGTLASGTVTGNTIATETFTNSNTSAQSLVFAFSMTANGCNNNQNVTVQLNPTPGFTSTLTPADICNSTLFNYTATSLTAPVSFSWSRPTVTGISSPSPASGTGNISQILTNSTNAPIPVTYLYIVSTNGCANNTVFTVTFNVNPTASLTTTLTPSAICSSNNFTYIANSSTNLTTTTYAWSRAAISGINGGAASSGSGTTISQLLTNTNVATTGVVYAFTLTAYGCSNNQSVTVNVYPVPVLTSTTSPLPICSGAAFSYSPSNSLAGTSFNWVRTLITGISNPAASGTNDPAETLINSSSLPVTVNYAYTLITTAGCTNTQNVPVTVNPKPVLSSALQAPGICTGSLFSYTPSSNTPGTLFSWTRAVAAPVTNGASLGLNDPGEYLVNPTINPGTVTYSYTLSANGCSNTQAVTVAVNPIPVVSPQVAATCSNIAFSITPSNAPAATLYTWTTPTITPNGSVTGAAAVGTGQVSVSQLLTNQTTNAATAVYLVTPNASGCVGSVFSVTVTLNPTLSVAPSPIPVCSGAAFSYSPTNASQGSSFNWVRTAVTGISNPAGSGSGSNGPAELLVNTTALPVNVSYAYTFTTNLGCSSSLNIPVIVNPIPVLSSSLQPPAICSGTLFSYTPLSNTPGTVFSWTRAVMNPITNGAASGSNNPLEFLVNPTVTAATTTYAFSLTANGCGNTQLVTVSVSPVPAVLPIVTATCSNIAFSVTPSNVPANTVYTWLAPVITPTGSSTGGTSQVTSAQSLISQVLNNQTANTSSALYTVTPSTGLCSGNPFTITVTINPVPFIASQLLPGVCSGSAFSFTASFVPTGTVYTWNNPLQSPLNSLTGGGAQPVNQPSVTQTLTSNNKIVDTAFYTVVPATAFCVGSAFSVTVPVKPIPVIVDLRDTICSGSAFFQTPSSGLNNTTFTWGSPALSPSNSITGGGPQIVPVSSISQTLINTTSAAAQAVYTIIPSVANCAGPAFTLIETVSRPIPSFGNIPALICSGTAFNATPSNAPSGTTYTWTIPTSNPTGGVTGVSAALTPQTSVSQTLSNVLTVTDTVTYTVMPFLNNCQGPTFTAIVSVAPIPRVIISGASSAVCQNPVPDTLSLKFIGTAPWSFTYSDSVTTQTKTGITSSPYSLILPVYPAALSKRVITITNVKDYACTNPTTDTTRLQQKINPLPVVQIISMHGTYLCDGIKDTLYVKAPGAVSYQWNINANASAGLTSDSITTLSAGAYNAKVTNQFGCSDTAAAPAVLIVATQPALKFSLDTSCIKSFSHFTNLTDTTTTGTIQWLWKLGNGDSATTMNSATTYNTAGKYHVLLKATQLVCTAYQPTVLDSLISISFPISDSILPSVSTYKSTVTPVAGRSIPGYKYKWVPSLGIEVPDSISTNFNYSSTQQYAIKLISPAGCVTSDSLTVRVFDDNLIGIFVPKSFTPNGDGLNDILYPYIAGMQQFHYFRVINRYGKLLFETRNKDQGWNGMVNGVAQPMSVYFWIAEGVANDGSIIQKTGQVLLIR